MMLNITKEPQPDPPGSMITGASPPTAPSPGGARTAIMAELKDIFVKKGVYREYK